MLALFTYDMYYIQQLELDLKPFFWLIYFCSHHLTPSRLHSSNQRRVERPSASHLHAVHRIIGVLYQDNREGIKRVQGDILWMDV